MKILFSELPLSPWWGNGMPHYQNNWMMKKGMVPQQSIVIKEHAGCGKLLKRESDVISIPFPEELDTAGHYKHDFIFVRDHFISDQNGSAVISNFSEKHRQEEAGVTSKFLQSIGIRTYRISDDAHAEGGEFYFHPHTGILFAGTVRNNRKGIAETAKFLGAKEVCIIESHAFHLDSLFTPVIDSHNTLIAAITCPLGIKNWHSVESFLKSHTIHTLPIPLSDCLGTPAHPGSLAVNCLPLPGVMIGSSTFPQPNIEEKLMRMGIRHEVTPTTQCRLSGGGVHCLTNELF